MKKNFSINLLSGIIMSYLLLALIWWTILLLQKNEDAYLFQSNNIKLYQEKTLGINEYDISKDHEYLLLTEEYSKQRWMILGEGIFFGLSMIIGIGLILRSSKRTIATNKQQNNFLLAITHELKTPVASVKLILQTIFKRSLNKEQLESLASNALQENQRLESLVDNILLSTKLIDGYHFHMESIDFKELLAYLTITQNKRLQLRKVTFIDKTENTSCVVKADRNALIIALNNLVDNAIKYSSDDVQIVLSNRNDHALSLAINDAGKGIEAKEAKLIFDKFYRSGNEETRDSKGTGLGLYLVKEIINAHNGKVYYQKGKPTGSQFIIELDLSV